MSSLRRITNQSEYDVSYIKLENRGNNGNVPKNSVGEMDVWFPWVNTPGEFASKVIVVEMIGLARIYLWESDQYLWYCISKENLEGPFNRNTNVTIMGNEFSSGLIVPGDATRNNKELEIRNRGTTISIKMYNC